MNTTTKRVVIVCTKPAELPWPAEALSSDCELVFCTDRASLAQILAENAADLLCLLPPVPDRIDELLPKPPDRRVPVVAVWPNGHGIGAGGIPAADRVLRAGSDWSAFCRAATAIVTEWNQDQHNQLLQGLALIRDCFLNWSEDPDENIAHVARLLARLLPAALTMYNRITDGTFQTVAHWPEGTVPAEPVPADGHICLDVVQHGPPVFLEVHHLSDTLYAETDPIVREIGAETYVGRTVTAKGRPAGSLCALYTEDTTPSETQRMLMELVADLVGREEDRRQLAASEHRYRDMLDNLPVGIYRKTPDGRILEANRELVRMLGYPDRDTLLATNVNEMFSDRRDRESWMETIQRRGTHHHARYVTKTWDGTAIWVEDHGRAVTDDTGRVRWFEGTMVDVTDRVELEENLRMAQKLDAIGRLAGGFAHEFNNLLTVINGYAEMMMSQMLPSDPHRDKAAAVLKAGQRAARLVSQLLAYGQKQMIAPKAVNLAMQVQSMADMIRGLAGETIRVSIECNEPLPEIKADPRQLEQVVLNLVHNGITAIRERPDRADGTLTIQCDTVSCPTDRMEHGTTIPAGDYVRLTVADTGVGITEDIRPLIFEPFFTTREIGQGTGLGLSTVYGILKQNGGVVTVESTPGKGSTFRVYWPILPPGPLP